MVTLLLMAAAHATQITYHSPTQLAKAADLIIEASVDRIWYEPFDSEDKGLVVTRVLLTQKTAYKGGVESGKVVLTLPGGEHPDGSFSYIDGEPTLHVGDTVIAHLLRIDDERVRLLDWATAVLVLPVDRDSFGETRDGQGRVVAGWSDAGGWMLVAPLDAPLSEDVCETEPADSVDTSSMLSTSAPGMTAEQARQLVSAASDKHHSGGATLRGYTR